MARPAADANEPMYTPQTPRQTQMPVTQQSAARRRSVGNLIGLVLGSLFASCFVFVGIATYLADESESERSGTNPGQPVAAPARAVSGPAGPLTPEECEGAWRNAEKVLPRMNFDPPPSEICLPKFIAKWGPDGATQLRCVADATSPGELQLCGGHWMGTVADYMEKFGDGDSAKDSDAVAADLGVGARARDRLAAVAKAYGVSQRTVGDKAAKAAEICLGGVAAVAAKPARAVRKVEGALEFAAKVVSDLQEAGAAGLTKDAMDLNELFVTYVTQQCPDPSTGG